MASTAASPASDSRCVRRGSALARRGASWEIVYLVHIDGEAESSVSSVIESYVLRVRDLDKATEFWEKVFGVEVVGRSGSDAATEVTLRSSIGSCVESSSR